ncbi:MAG: class I SAM-dependent methyltransferase [Panacagrimonas sp.]
MESNRASRTAMFTAILRGQHRQLHAPPWVFDDPYALPLVGPGWPQIHAQLLALFGETIFEELIGTMCCRARYVEERLAAGHYTQFVILGAGLDSFAWRRPDLLHALRVFEIDHPASQAVKRERVQTLALPLSDRHIFTPIDFETTSLREGLDAVGFDASQCTFYSCLGVLIYLTTDAIQTLLRTVAAGAAGSEIVATYGVTPAFLDGNGKKFWDIFASVAAESGEGAQSSFAPAEMQALVEGCGLQVAEDLSRDAQHERYFAGRSDGLTPNTVERLIAAVVR